MNKKLNRRLKTTFIGCGQCGCQIVSEIEKRVMGLDGTKDNTSFVGINSSLEDLSAVNLSHKIHMKNCTGAAGNRNRSLDALAENIDEILPELQKYIIDGSTVFIAFSMGGGTGSAIGPVLARILLEMGYKMCLILVLPSDKKYGYCKFLAQKLGFYNYDIGKYTYRIYRTIRRRYQTCTGVVLSSI